jgi:enediyne biosynthesis protein E4
MKKFTYLVFTLLLISCSRPPKFQILNSKQTGIDFNNRIVETDSLNIASFENIYNGAGTGIGDFNNDGLQDIVFAGNQVKPGVYLNLGNFKFRDITSNLEGLSNNQWYSGVTLADINGDGLLDVYLTSTAGKDPLKRKNRLWINNGIKDNIGPTFTEMAEKYGIADTSQSVAAAFFDYDLDGYIDLYVLNNTVNSRMNTTYRPRTIDGSSPDNDRLYHNNKDGTFTDVTKQAGIVYEGFGLGLAVGDVNKDGYPDIYISNDYLSNDLLYINQGNGTFRNEIKTYLSYQSTSSMGNDMADVNNDGNPDILTLDMMPEDYSKKKQTINGFSYIYYLLDEKFNYEHQYLRNMLHMHNGFIGGEMLPYSEAGQLAGIYQTDWSWAPLFADYDNDGDKDLIITKGYPKDLTDKDFYEYRKKMKGYEGGDRQMLDLMPSVKLPNVAFENVGDLQFTKRTDWMPAIPSYSYGASFADLDNDGDLDYVISNLNENASILRNNTRESSKENSNYLKIRLKGKTGNTLGLGAKIELWYKNNYQYAEHFLTRGYASSVDPVTHFGLTGNSLVDSLKVTWPGSKNITLLKNITANQLLDLDEDSSTPVVHSIKPGKTKEMLFKRCDNLMDYSHEQTDFTDYFLNQKILPHKFSQIGPALARGDIDNDGRDDILIGSTNKQPTTVFRRQGKGFEKLYVNGLTTQKDFSESDLAILDIDRDGDNDVVAVAGGYETRTENDNREKMYKVVQGGYDIQNESKFKHFLYENKNGSFAGTELPVPGFLASVIRPCDFNHDGFPELFIGSRVKRGIFPYADYSWLIYNNKGKLSVASDSKLNLGMVTDAVWTDYDNDGWEDLMVTSEWSSISILKNINGKELVPQNIPQLEAMHGLWYSIIAGDFDKDGDEDYIVGNLGDNHRFTVSDKYPLNMYVIDLDLDDIIDPLITGYWKDQNGRMKEYPVNYLDELREQSTFYQTKFKDYTSFSYADIKEILDEGILKRMIFKPFVNTTSSYIIWNDRKSFRWEKLPQAVQTSPARKMITEDINGDGYPDVIIGGNDYTYDVATGYYDANKGIVLLNKGNNRENGKLPFDVLTPSQSGLFLKGMVESLLYFSGDTSLVVAGINREHVTVYEHTARPPLK